MKEKSKKYGIVLALILAVLILPTGRVYAYIDPATSSYVVQIAVGVVVACSAAVGVFWKRITMFFKKKKIERLGKKLSKRAQDKEK